MSFHLPQWLHCLVSHISQSEDLDTVITTLLPALKDFLEMDRVMLCTFESDKHVQVLAESVNSDRLPSLLQSRFQADYISPYTWEVWQSLRIGTVLDLGLQNICQFSWSSEPFFLHTKDYFALNPQQKLNLIDLGIQFALIVPIFKRGHICGLLVAHCIDRSPAYNGKLEFLKVGLEQLTVSINQQILQTQSQKKSRLESGLKQLEFVLKPNSGSPNLKAALEIAVSAFQGLGGRLCVCNLEAEADSVDREFSTCLQQFPQLLKVYQVGAQPDFSDVADDFLLEKHSRSQEYSALSQYKAWLVAEIDQGSQWSPLFQSFQHTGITALLIIPLFYRQKLLGYLSIFKGNTERKSQKQLFESQSWEDFEWAKRLNAQLAMALYEQDLLHKHSYHLASTKDGDLQKIADKQQSILFEVLSEISAGKVDAEMTVRQATQAFCQALQVERVSLYKFDENWGGEFLHNFEYAVPAWRSQLKIGENTVWNDSYLQDNEGGRYRYHETCAVDDIYKAGLSSCHVDILEQFGFKAFAIAPIFVRDRLWGLLCAYQHSQPYHWQPSDTAFLTQAAMILGLALHAY